MLRAAYRLSIFFEQSKRRIRCISESTEDNRTCAIFAIKNRLVVATHGKNSRKDRVVVAYRFKNCSSNGIVKRLEKKEKKYAPWYKGRATRTRRNVNLSLRRWLVTRGEYTRKEARHRFESLFRTSTFFYYRVRIPRGRLHGSFHLRLIVSIGGQSSNDRNFGQDLRINLETKFESNS